ncbi:primosomal protein N' [Brachybacterium sp. AOP25-B2-12]|uniref:primosomal protein N' family DNA-binding protein n=1 Tax=Brachybacterium sp. AOP25-B2-12 TaxID=3457710 RepID=UPI004034949B
MPGVGQEGLFDPPPGPARAAPSRSSTDAGAGRPDGRPRTTAGFELAPTDPVAEVRLIGPLPHLDRPFEYAVTAETAAAGPGMRVKVRFSGQEMDGIVVARRAHATTDRPLAPLRRLLSEDVVLPPHLLRVCADVAARCAGTVGDVLRLALPPRHARAETADRAAAAKEAERAAAAGQAEPAAAVGATRCANAAKDSTGSADAGETEDPGATAEDAEPTTAPDPAGILTRYRGAEALLARAGDPEGPVPRAGIVLEPVDAWTRTVAEALRGLPDGAGSLTVAPDQRDVDRLSAELTAQGIPHEVLASADGPEKRYRAFLRILRGASRTVIGTRSAAFAPVRDLALMILWDGADDLLVEPRAPYPHTLTVLQCRSAEEHAALLLLSAARSTTEAHLAGTGYLRMLEPVPAPVRQVRPRIQAMDDYLRDREGPSGRSRLPQEAMRVIRDGLARGPVLVQVPRGGYAPAIACTFCGTRCICPLCAAPLSQAGRGGPLVCRVCGRREDGYRCPECDRTQVRAVVIGSTRTAEELRRAFPEVPFRVAGGAHGAVADDDVPDGAIVVATPGAEPWPTGRYAAALLLDADAMLARAAYDADVEAVRRWSDAVALVRTADDGGEVLIVGTSTLPAIRDLVAHRSAAFLDRVLEDRRTLDLPPFSKVAEISGDKEACRAFLEDTPLPDGTHVLGPVDDVREGDRTVTRAVVRIDPSRSRELLAVLRAGVASRSARKAGGSLRVQVDPPDVF